MSSVRHLVWNSINDAKYKNLSGENNLTVAGQAAAQAGEQARLAAIASGASGYYDRGQFISLGPSTQEKLLQAAVQTGQGFGSLGGSTVESRAAYARSLGFSPTEVRTATGELPFGSRRSEKQQITQDVLKLEQQKRVPISTQQKRYASLIQSLNERERGQAPRAGLTTIGRVAPEGAGFSVFKIPGQTPLRTGHAETTKIVSVGQPIRQVGQELQSIKTPVQTPAQIDRLFRVKQFGGEISQPSQINNLQQKLFGKQLPLQKGESPLAFESRVIEPQLQKLFLPFGQFVESKERQALRISEVLRFKVPQNIPEEKLLFTGVVKETGSFLSKPSNVASLLALGGGFVAVEEGLSFGITKVPKILEAVTSPTGTLIIKGGKVLLGGALVVGETLRAKSNPSPSKGITRSILETSALFTGSGIVRAGFETPFVRESGFGSPSRRIEEVRGIKSITEEGFREAIKTSKTAVSPETIAMSAEQLKAELRSASDIVAQSRGKVRLPEREITPEFLQANLKERPSLNKARQTVELLQKFAPDIFLKGSITQRNRQFGDIDLAINEKLKGAFERAKGKTLIGFDIKTLEEGRQTATAQIEPLQRVGFKVGNKVRFGRETGVIEQFSRKVEGSIRFATGQEGGETRAKDIADVLGLKKTIEEQRRPKLFKFESLAEGENVKVFENKPSRFVRSSLTNRFEPSRIATRSELSRGQSPKSIEKSLNSLLKSKSSSFSKSFSGSSKPSFSPSISPSVSKSVSPSPSSSPSPSPSPSSSPSISPSVSRSFSRSFSSSPSISPSVNFVKPARFVGIPTLPKVGERSFNFENLGRVETKFKPSLFGIVLGKRIKAAPVGKTFGGFELRGVPTGLKGKLGGLFENIKLAKPRKFGKGKFPRLL